LYNQRRSFERKGRVENSSSSLGEQEFEAKERLKSLQVSNLIYPSKIQDVLNQDRKLRSELPNESEIINDWDLDAHSPKFAHLLSQLTPDKTKYVIYTRFLERHGLKALEVVFGIAGWKDYVFTLQGANKQRTSVIDEFNQIIGGILITTIIPLTPIHNVDQVFIIEGNAPEKIEQLLKSMINVDYYDADQKPKLSLIFLLAMPEDQGQSSDEYFYDQFITQEKARRRGYNQAYNLATNIIVKENQRYLIKFV
jgi:hypothetical protein